MARETDNTHAHLTVAAGAAVIALGIALARGWEPGVASEWVWRRNDLLVRLWAPMAAGVALTAVTAALCTRWERLRSAWRGLLLGALVLVVFAFQVGSLNAIGQPWVTPGAYVVSPNVTTYFAVSLDVSDPARLLARYPDLLATLPYHAATHPPGLVLLFFALRKACAAVIGRPSPWLTQVAEDYELFGVALTPADAAAAVVGALVFSLLGALGLIPIFLLSRRLAAGKAAACATCLAASMPALLLLGASPDLVIMSLTATALWLGDMAWRGKAWLGVFAGAVVALGLFISLGFGLVVVWAALWAAFRVMGERNRSSAARRALWVGLAAAGGLAAFYLALHLAYGYEPLAVARAALSAHRVTTASEGVRTYWKWALMNPVECALFAGLPLAVAALWSWRALRAPDQQPLRLFVYSWLALILLLDVSGLVRGEVGRIWLFLLWPAGLAASAWLGSGRGRARTAALLVLMQVVQALMMKGYLTIYSIL